MGAKKQIRVFHAFRRRRDHEMTNYRPTMSNDTWSETNLHDRAADASESPKGVASGVN